MSIHIGQKIKERAKELNIGPTRLGEMINSSKQNVYGIFKRKSIDTELLKKISDVLKKDFFEYYGALPSFQEDKNNYQKLNNRKIAEIVRELEKCKKEIEHLKEEISSKEIQYLKKINQLLEKKK
ncbi:MAG TPA: hypothetical protein VNW99_07020 [Cytophagaceae bacterium]|jgi:hypothetical protein|nr:hypothetical protein [Cytophagaceae bacterium]